MSNGKYSWRAIKFRNEIRWIQFSGWLKLHCVRFTLASFVGLCLLSILDSPLPDELAPGALAILFSFAFHVLVSICILLAFAGWILRGVLDR